MKALQIAATGMTAQQMRVDTISHNMANMSTTGYDPRRVDFADLDYEQYAKAGSVTSAEGTILPTGIQLGMGVRPVGVSVLHSQGALTQTGGDLDLAIDGKGYIEVRLPGGQTGYTRDGSLQRTNEGLIVTSDGYEVGQGITIPTDATSVSINAEGEVYAYFNNQSAPEIIGQILLTNFTNPKGLEAIGSNLFRESAASGPGFPGTPGSDGLGMLRQGYLEDSSVDAVHEVTELIKAQRSYEMNAKIITAADQMLSATTQVR